MKSAGVKATFEAKDFIACLKQIKHTFGEANLDEKNLQVAVNMAVQLGNILGESKEDVSVIEEKQEMFYLPDSNGVMRPIADLCMRDCYWMPDEIGVIFVNDMIPSPVSTLLGVKTRREETLKHFSTGIPFGQKEKLTNRLRRILTAYPCEKEILKELLQNADDAQATEICFIKDPRHHPDERVLEDSWKPLQGPALCVYNNKPFTEADIVGIQNLGEGSKGDDPNKTGQYGVGFNAVYHLTDVPSFASSGEAIGDVLCIFDPHCKYVPGATVSKPGMMFREVKRLKNVFPDVFSCYNEEEFPLKNSTMFRFPLRTEDMANKSKISNTPVTLDALDDVMEALKKELFEVLLFVNSVRKITLCDIDLTTGKIINSYFVEAEMSEEDATKKQEFATYIRDIGKSADQRDDTFPNNIEVKKCSYVLNLRDNLGNEEKWLIVQQMGFENKVETSITDAYKKGDLGMLPRGSVACLLQKKSTQSESENQGKKAYCFLPLPLKTNLPVHINGHFALDHEARRNLWSNDASDYRSDWNNALLGDVIASCYLTLLDEVRNFLDLPVARDAQQVTLHSSKDALLRNIDDYEKLFPLVVSDKTYWAALERSLYQGMDKKRLRLLPVVRGGETESTTSEVQLTWLPPTGEGKDKAFFNNLGESDCFAIEPRRFTVADIEKEAKRRIWKEKRFEDILLQTGFNLVKFSLSVYDALKNSGVDCHCLSPSAVVNFYKTFSDEEPLCWIGPISVHVDKTPFRNADSVSVVLKYCKDDENFLENLPGLPLLLTQNNHFHAFSTYYPKFLSRHYGVLPQCREMFVHDHIRVHIFNAAASLKSPVFKHFGVQDFSSNLHQTLPPQYFGSEGYVKWCPKQESEPNEHWVKAVWNFLNEETKDVLKELEPAEKDKKTISAVEEEEIKRIKAILQPLSNWSILPCTETIQTPLSRNKSTLVGRPEHYLAPLALAESVLDLTCYHGKSDVLVEALRQLSLAEVNYAVLPMDSWYLARKLVASFKTPESLLKSLEQRMKTNPKAVEGKLKSSECHTILEYFSDNVKRLQERDKSTLKGLPFYLATHGGLISINNEMVCVLPLGIIREEMDELERRVNLLFLEEWQRLLPLFKFLEFQCVSAVEVYCNFILQYFAIFSNKVRLTHLEYIRDVLLPSVSVEDNRDKQRLLRCLSDTAIVTSTDGILKRASSYYDRNNEVFSTMFSEDMFPPEPFNKPEWLSFLKQTGLICEVSPDLFQRFATDVEREATMLRTEKTYKKSKVLVKHLFGRKNVVEEGLLRSVCHIRFVGTDPVKDELRAIHRPFGEGWDGQTPFTTFKGSVLQEHTKIAWTTAAILPDWANPRNYQYHVRPPDWQRASDFCNDMLCHLQVLTEPTLDQVVFHCQNVCFQLAKENDVAPSCIQQQTRMSLMSNIYRFLQVKAVSGTATKERLQHTPCILVEKGTRFVYAKQVVIELYESLEIKPFLYKMPNELSKFTKVFEYLGCSPFVTPSCYVMVLDMLHGKCQAKQLHVNEVDGALRAVKGLLETLQDLTDAAHDISSLYLPATCPYSVSLDDSKGRLPVVLMKATELIFDNAPLYRDRIENFKAPFVVDLERANVCCKGNANYEEVIMRLPTKVRPQMMSCAIDEQFSDSDDNTECFDVGAASSLRKQLHSEQFYRGIVRLIRHANQDGGLDQNVVTTVKSSLQRIEFLGMSRIVTHLVHNGIVIQGSEREVPYFLEKVLDSDQQIWKVYVNAVEDVEETMSTIALTLTEVIAEACRGLLRGTTMYIPEMLRCQLGKIWSLLDKMRIRQDDSYDKEKGDVFPQPGSFIPIAEHNLLNPAFKAFAPGEYVGYELGDPSLQLEEGDAIYIYAVIMEEVSDDSVSLLAKSYKINIGHDKEPIIARATELYKFHRVQEVASSALVPIDQQGSSQFSTDKQQIFDEVSRTLEEAWRLPKEIRKQIIKRLILLWHPDKNPGNKSFCTEVFQHIKNEIERLEREQRWSSDGGNYHGSYGVYFGFWGARARRYNSQRQEYRNNFFRNYGSRSHRARSWEVPPSFCATNPQPVQARRWFRQAEADLAAVDNDLTTVTPSYVWACFKCHQAAEKALKAAQYSVDSNKTNVHNLVQNSLALEDSQLTTLSSQLERRVGDSTRMRYPDQVDFPEIPSDIYSQEMAGDALELAKKILDNVRSRVR